MVIKEGQRVLLRANKMESWPEEKGTVIYVQEDYEGMLTVEVDADYISEPFDDGIREIHINDVDILEE